VRLPEPLTFFVDRSLGTVTVPGHVLDGLLAGEDLKIHDALFAQNANDEEWLTCVGDSGWVGLTKDDALRRRPGEINALLAASSAIFIFGSSGDLSGEIIGRAFRVALPRMRRAIRRFHVAIIGRVTRAGEVSILWENGTKRATPAQIK
jgi:PIN domain-containing protein